VNNFGVKDDKEFAYCTETASNKGLGNKLEGSLDNIMSSYYKCENNDVNLRNLLTQTNDSIYVFCIFDYNCSWI